jgi:hypothetical protein
MNERDDQGSVPIIGFTVLGVAVLCGLAWSFWTKCRKSEARKEQERELDHALEETFPASDPVSSY